MQFSDTLTLNYSERVRRLALFEPLFELDRLQRKDLNGKTIPMKDFGFLTLLFFFEHKLMRNQKVNAADLGDFLKEMTGDRLSISDDSYLQIAREIIMKFRPSGGKCIVPYYNWETKVEESVQFSFLRDNDFQKGIQYYTLDEDGLELVFATREFYSEFQLSIHQLMLRKQLEKGEFKSALRQMNEMFIEVERLNERMLKVGREIKRNIVSSETFSRYQKLLEDIYDRLKRENEEFDELTTFVKETQDHLYYENIEQEERTAYRYILEIAKELERVHGEHGALLFQCMEMKNTALKAAHESLYFSGVASFNFEQDITTRLLNSPAALEGVKGLAAPFGSLEQIEVWSPLTIFEPQLIGKIEEEQKTSEFLVVDEEEQKMKYAVIQNEAYGEIMRLLIVELETQPSLLFSAFIASVVDTNLLDHRLFYEFLLVLHQRSPLHTSQSFEESTTEHALSSIFSLLGNRTLTITEQKKILQVTERYSIQEMLFQLEGGVEDV
ncbi:replicative DNA helicase [Sporosarcina sp. FSL K6-3457]|uniref:replicative DNA helicase n=1 Tax=Sporosarcina sp. FSL K6-3457 TaxID=2978204 RepID=UPI0030F7FDF0